MAINYVYIQKRSNFGKICRFTNVGPHLLIDIDPNSNLRSQYVEVSSIEKETQCSNEMSLHEVNTVLHPTKNCGMKHTVGGWPADVDPMDDDQVARFKKKIQKDENFIGSIKKLGDLVENFVMENNSVDIYEEYFVNEFNAVDYEAQFKTVNVYRDYSDKKRKVLDLSWSLDGCKISAAHGIGDILKYSLNTCHDSYVWDIENSNTPYCILMPDSPLNCTEYSSRDLELLLGGYSNGQIGLWDVRTGGFPQQLSPMPVSHKEGVSDLKWISSKTGLEFFSASTDGKLICWDSRNISSPCQTFLFDQKIQDNSNRNKKYNITCIEYDPTLPHRFMLGTEQGIMLSCNRKCKDPNEMISSYYDTQSGPIINIVRNAFFPKLLASCGTWGIKIWSEDLMGSPMLNLRSQIGYCTDAAWSPSHASFLFITKTTGNLELWDILIKNHEPIISLKLESDGLACVLPKQSGDQIACGTATGCIHLLNIPEYYSSTSKQEKNLVAAMIDREGKREKFLEGKTREQKMRQKTESEKVMFANTVVDTNAEELYGEEDKDDARNHSAEFVSKFNNNLQGTEDEVLENTFPEVTFFELQFTDTLKSVLDTCRENQL